MREVTTEARSDNLHLVFEALMNELAKYGVSPAQTRQCKLCVEEVFMNISNYAYRPGTGRVTMKIDADPRPHKLLLKVIFCDNGKPFDPLSIQDPDVDSELKHRMVGGLGIYLVKNTMDKVHYDRTDTQNVLTMEKTLVI